MGARTLVTQGLAIVALLNCVFGIYFLWLSSTQRNVLNVRDRSRSRSTVTLGANLYEEVSQHPVVVIASNRSGFLHRTLKSLLSARGAQPHNVLVSIDGQYQEPYDVAHSMGVKIVRHNHQPQAHATDVQLQDAPQSIKIQTGRICYHHKRSIRSVFDSFPTANYAIVLEDDLQVSADFFEYFNQTIPLLVHDASLYTVSAWNDLGYSHMSTNDSSLVFRTHTMPGLGYVIGRKLFTTELEPVWPEASRGWDWDQWMRMPQNQHGRDSIVPHVSRVFHFGYQGVHVNRYFQQIHFDRRSLSNATPGLRLRGLDHVSPASVYDDYLVELMRNATPYNYDETLCLPQLTTTNVTYSVIFPQTSASDYKEWLRLASCLHIWDLDVRGGYKDYWRLWWHNNHFIVLGSASPLLSRI